MSMVLSQFVTQPYKLLLFSGGERSPTGVCSRQYSSTEVHSSQIKCRIKLDTSQF